MPVEAIVALQKGVLIEAIKHTREKTGLGLKDSKETVERYLEQHPITKAQFKAAASANFKQAVRSVLFVFAVSGLIALGYLIATENIK